MESVRWRSSPSIDAALESGTGVRVVVLTGNGSWLARQAVLEARRAGYAVATTLPSAGEADRASWFEAVLQWPHLGESVEKVLQIATVIAVLDRRILGVAVGTGVGAALSEPAIRWLQARRVDPVFVEAAKLAQDLPKLQLVVVDLDHAGAYAVHLVHLIARRASQGAVARRRRADLRAGSDASQGEDQQP